MEDVLHRVHVKTMRVPFRKILGSDRRIARFIKIWTQIRKDKRRMWFSRLVDYSFYQMKTFSDMKRFFILLKKKTMMNVLRSLKYYQYSVKIVCRKFITLRRVMVKNCKADILHFFAACKQMSFSVDSPYEIPLELNSPSFPFAQSTDSGQLDISSDRERPKNIFNHDETSDSKHYSDNRLEHVETFQGFGSRDENVIKNSNFNTFYQPDKEGQNEFHLNSYGTFNKFNESWVKQVGSPYESVRDNLEKKLVTIEDVGEENEELSKSSQASDRQVVVKGEVKRLPQSGDLSEVSGKSDQASFSVEKKVENSYSVGVGESGVSKKKAKFVFHVPKVEIKATKKKFRPFGNFTSNEGNLSEKKNIEERKLTESETRDKAIFEELKKKSQPKNYDTKSRVKNEVFRQMDQIQKSKSQAFLKKEKSQATLTKDSSMLSLVHLRSTSKKSKQKSLKSKNVEKTRDARINPKFLKQFGRKTRRKSRSRIKEVAKQLFDERLNSAKKSRNSPFARERSVDGMSWNVQKSVILKSDTSVINLKVQKNFKNQMKIALEIIAEKIKNAGKSKRKREQVLINFSKILELYEQFLDTLLRSGKDSQLIRTLKKTIVDIGGRIKKGISKGRFKKDLKNLRIDSLSKIIEFLKAVLTKDLLQSTPFDSSSQNTNNFGTISSDPKSQKYNSQIDNQFPPKRFGEGIGIPVYSSEVFKRNVSSPLFNFSNKRISTGQISKFNNFSEKEYEFKSFCILLNYKLNFKIKKKMKEAWMMIQRRPKRLPKKWKKLPKVFVPLMKRKLLVSLKMLKIFNIRFKLKQVKKSTRRRQRFK